MIETAKPGEAVLRSLHDWLTRFIGVMRDDDIDILTLWIAHSHFTSVTRTTPRLLISSPVPGSGKTTLLEHMGHLALDSVQMSTISSPALLTRMLAERPRTVLIDEADRSLNPKNEGVGEILAVINTGYKQGATRPVLVPHKEEGWVAKEFPTYAPVAIAGNSPNLPEDTLQRCIVVHMAPSDDVEESDWEGIEHDAAALGEVIGKWAEGNLNVAKPSPPLPEAVTGRNKEKWRPLKRVAVAAGGRWPETVDRLALADVQRIETEKEDGILQDRPHIILLKHLAEIWPRGQSFTDSKTLLDHLTFQYPDVWGSGSSFDKSLTYQRMGRMLSKNFGLQTDRPNTQGPRGYSRAKLNPLWSRLGIPLPDKPDKAAQPAEPDNTFIHISSSATLSGSPETPSDSGSACPLHGTSPVTDCYTCDQIAAQRKEAA
ncbi:DUF3631 domain-containing protein [Nesterenkonia sp. E16_7]|uniref:DUF3631 domain-containing protein n=1 Tax=unclassified Nesterenkonia TaxID=2629769 RepID=UPI001A9106CD|nr:DUF3631 domain-containing protein [Nesterenkonia sp. E16_10]MBO0597298.1 DUF3631 domain-containing protein [Nesterenkonia sp. E16_7]